MATITKRKPKPDLQFENHGSIFTLYTHSERGEDWVKEHLPEDVMRFGEAYVIDHRYAWDICQGAMNDGLNVI